MTKTYVDEKMTKTYMRNFVWLSEEMYSIMVTRRQDPPALLHSAPYGLFPKSFN